MSIYKYLRAFLTFVFFAIVLPSTAFPAIVQTYGGSFHLRIPDSPDDSKGWMADAVINVPDHFNIADLDVGIDITHTSAFDLQIFLINPAGTTICLSKFNINEFFIGANYTQTIFDDEAAIPIEQADVPFTGRFKPRTGVSLTAFDNFDAFGTWKLRVGDIAYNDTGFLNEFTLMFTVPEPAVIFLFGFGIIAIRRFKKHKN